MDLASSTFPIKSVSVKTDDLKWAPMSSVIGEKRMRSQIEVFKYRVRHLLSTKSRSKFITRISRHEFGRKVFETNPENYYVPLRSYLDSRFNVRERFDACFVDIETARLKFGVHNADCLLRGESVGLIQLGQFKVDLQLNRVSQHEGFWAVTLKDGQGKTVTNLSFGFLDLDTVLIASIQGVKDCERNILELNKRVTKEALGLRPPNLLIAALQALCNVWEIKNLIGIDPRYQVKRRLNTERQGFKFDYARLWTELDAVKNFISGYWVITTSLPIRNLSEVPSNKRSQYKKRNELLDVLQSNTEKSFEINSK